LIKTTASWSISANTEFEPPLLVEPSNQKQMTENVVAARPSQPTVYTYKVTAIQPSRFASSVNFSHFSDAENYASGDKSVRPSKSVLGNDEEIYVDKNDEEIETPAPVAHLANNNKTLLADFPFGSGQIVFLTDPYIVSNGGINLIDNARLAINIVASREGVIAFDEFHQGFGKDENRLLAYFAGTPAVAIFLQFAALVGLILFSQSRRFARPLPENEPSRLSKLEYVSAMAELQRRTRAYDLAVENIYTDFRRRVSKLVGADNFTVSVNDLARMIAERGNYKTDEIENLMFKCEDIIRGEPTEKHEVLRLTARLREVEEKLGLPRNRKQIFRK
jgi:hypothetical protein